MPNFVTGYGKTMGWKWTISISQVSTKQDFFKIGTKKEKEDGFFYRVIKK